MEWPALFMQNKPQCFPIHVIDVIDLCSYVTFSAELPLHILNNNSNGLAGYNEGLPLKTINKSLFLSTMNKSLFRSTVNKSLFQSTMNKSLFQSTMNKSLFLSTLNLQQELVCKFRGRRLVWVSFMVQYLSGSKSRR